MRAKNLITTGEAGPLGKGAMAQITTRLVDQLFNSPNEIMIMNHLAEWNREHLNSRFASAQLYDPGAKRLRVVAQSGFRVGLLSQFGDIPITSGTVCARAARLQVPVLIPDVNADPDWNPFLDFSETAGFGGVLSIPVLSKPGDLIGVTSCHFAGSAKPSKSEMKFALMSCEFASDAVAELRWRTAQ